MDDINILNTLSNMAVYDFHNPPIGNFEGGFTTKVHFWNCTTQEAIQDLYSHDLAVLSFACAKNPAGKNRYNKKGQEYDLYQNSTLPLIMSHMQTEAIFYIPNRSTDTYAANNVLYLPDVLFFNNTIVADVIACAAPCIRYGKLLSTSRLSTLLMQRIDLILSSALMHNKHDIILGAWGCGWNGIAPNIVADAFKKVLEMAYNGMFDNIIFAIPEGTDNLAVFKSILNDIFK